MTVPALRIRTLNQLPVRADGDYVVYWMTASRRLNWNFALQQAVAWCLKLNRPLVIFEPLRCDYPWASVRLHTCVLQGMCFNQRAAAAAGVFYLPYVEPSPRHSRGLLSSIAERACVVVTDDFPCFFIPHMQQAAARELPVLLETVDSNGLLPLRAASEIFSTAYAFRRFLQKNLASHLTQLPEEQPLTALHHLPCASLPESVRLRWPAADSLMLSADSGALSRLPIDQSVGRVLIEGGTEAADLRLREFLDQRLARYAEDRSHPDQDAASGLSPWLHFGHISAHQIFREIAIRQNWSVEQCADFRTTRGSREGWWRMSVPAESFLDELITWRELGFNMCWQSDNYDQYSSLPDWAQQTLADHAHDVRPVLYLPDQLQNAETHDALWNAAQTELLRHGRIQNYLRMLWGKKILEWSPSPEAALSVMIDLNNRYALDGRDPNSYSGIFWVLGRYDRAWGPERPIYGKIRYMTSDSTMRKLKVKQYLQQMERKD
jgi:deoxyribodipyrimidine photo-lyase